MHAKYRSNRPRLLRRLRKNPPSLVALPPPPRANNKKLAENLPESLQGPLQRSGQQSIHIFASAVLSQKARQTAKSATRPGHPKHPEAWPLIYRNPAPAAEPPRRGRDAGNAGAKQPGAVVGTKHPGAPPLLPGGQMAFLLLPDCPHPHPALLLEEAEERLPPALIRAGPLSHHPLSLLVTIVSPRALPLPGAGSASAAGCCCCRRFPPAAFAALRPPSPPPAPLPMPPIPCTVFSVSHSFAGMVTGLANLRNTVDSARETATLPESIPRFDNLVGGAAGGIYVHMAEHESISFGKISRGSAVRVARDRICAVYVTAENDKLLTRLQRWSFHDLFSESSLEWRRTTFLSHRVTKLFHFYWSA